MKIICCSKNFFLKTQMKRIGKEYNVDVLNLRYEEIIEQLNNSDGKYILVFSSKDWKCFIEMFNFEILERTIDKIRLFVVVSTFSKNIPLKEKVSVVCPLILESQITIPVGYKGKRRIIV